MNATQALDKIVNLLGLKFKRETFFSTTLVDGTTQVTNNMDSEFQVGQTLYVIGEATLQPAPAGEHQTREGLILKVDEESTIMEISAVQEEAADEVENETEMENSKKVSMVEAIDAQGQKLESDTFDVGEDVFVIGEDGSKTPAPDGEHQVVLKDTSGNEVKIRIQVADGKITQRENVEEMAKVEMKDYPWDKCISDMKEQYGSEEIAAKVCGAIKAGNYAEMSGAPENLEMKKDELVMKVLGSEFAEQIESIKTALSDMVSIVDSMNGKFKSELSSIKNEFNDFRNSPERKPIEKKLAVKDSFEDYRISILKELKNK